MASLKNVFSPPKIAQLVPQGSLCTSVVHFYHYYYYEFIRWMQDVTLMEDLLIMGSTIQHVKTTE